MPGLPISPRDLADQIAPFNAMKEAFEEAVWIAAQSSLVTAISTSVPYAADSDIKIGAEVLYLTENTAAKWESLFVMAYVDR